MALSGSVMRPLPLLLCAALLASACSRDSAEIGGGSPSAGGVVKATVSKVLPSREAKAQAEAAQAVTPEQIAAAALQSIKGPVLLATLQAAGATTVFGQQGRNGAMRSYATPDNRGLVLRDGMLAATRGFGRDLMSSETEESAALILAREEGTARRVQRYLDGSGTERPVPMTCEIRRGETVTQGPVTATQMIELCAPVDAQNSYLVNEAGQIVASRQWIGPKLGYLSLQVLRD